MSFLYSIMVLIPLFIFQLGIISSNQRERVSLVESESSYTKQSYTIDDIRVFTYCQDIGMYTLQVMTDTQNATFVWNSHAYTSLNNGFFQPISFPTDATFASYPESFIEFGVYAPGVYEITVDMYYNGGKIESFSKDIVFLDHLEPTPQNPI